MKQNPGKYSYASAGIGTVHHLSMALLAKRAQLDMVHVPYKGSGQILSDLIANQVPISYNGLGQTLTFINSGKVKAIAIGGEQRSSFLPDVGLVSELYPGFNGTSVWYLMAPSGTSPKIVDYLNKELNLVLKDQDVISQLAAATLPPLGGSSDEVLKRVNHERERWKAIIQEIGGIGN